MNEAVVEDMPDVLIREPVVHDSPDLAASHCPPSPEEPKLVGKGRLADPQEKRQVADAELFCQAQSVEDPGASRIREQAERTSGLFVVKLSDNPIKQGCYLLRVNALD